MQNNTRTCAYGGEVYLKRGTELPRYTILHEHFHLNNGHDTENMDAKAFVHSEIGAHKYTYEKTKKPSSIIKELRAVYNSLIGSRFNMQPEEALEIIHTEMNCNDISPRWLRDYDRLEKEVFSFTGLR